MNLLGTYLYYNSASQFFITCSTYPQRYCLHWWWPDQLTFFNKEYCTFITFSNKSIATTGTILPPRKYSILRWVTVDQNTVHQYIKPAEVTHFPNTAWLKSGNRHVQQLVIHCQSLWTFAETNWLLHATTAHEYNTVRTCHMESKLANHICAIIAGQSLALLTALFTNY